MLLLPLLLPPPLSLQLVLYPLHWRVLVQVEALLAIPSG
jgi:hypothetical protein